ncbi:hypothetical protein J5N97_010219 [Dioscorea zingiberensis]|uniref:CCHC-type domain-containing protein n=1 Tax=Dioscorea zingiberensis TaxID=325984 RepID=A0A9D5HMB5_9LILI|nr:hypothetical protein J5N97_010219 [Dioscorea zingiberensis]
MQTVVYGKFLGRAPPLGIVREALSRFWADLGEFTVADMPNGFFLIRCGTTEMTEVILTEGPWSINGMVLHLIRWRAHFQPSLEKLSTAIRWVRFLNLPTEYWEPEPLDSVAASIGRVIKIDDTTCIQDRAKYARVCLEIDLTRPLERGVWVNTGRSKCFVPILYEKLPVFCYNCGIVGHGAINCTKGVSGSRLEETGTGQQVSNPKGKEKVAEEAGTSARNTGPQEERMQDQPMEEASIRDPNFGGWMTVQGNPYRRRPVVPGGVPHNNPSQRSRAYIKHRRH